MNLKELANNVKDYWPLWLLGSAVFGAGIEWHSRVLNSALSPIVSKINETYRGTLVQRISGYRERACLAPLPPEQQTAWDVAEQQYQDLVGRPMGGITDCTEDSE